MSRYPSGLLTAPQLYHLGWLYENEVALWQEDGPKVFELRRVSAFDQDGLVAVMVRKAGRDAFVSFPPCKKGKSCVVLHLRNGGGSQRIKLFGNEYHDKKFTGLIIKKLGYSEETKKITVSIEMAGEPEDTVTKDELDDENNVEPEFADSEPDSEDESDNETVDGDDHGQIADDEDSDDEDEDEDDGCECGDCDCDCDDCKCGDDCGGDCGDECDDFDEDDK